MGDFDDMYDMGLVDKSGMPIWEENDTNYSTVHHNTNLVKESIIVSLTPDKYLNNEQQYKRSKFLNGHLDSYTLEVLHDNYNQNDSFALKVYCDGVMIGYIQKYNNPNNINEFSFKDNNPRSDLGIEFSNNTLTLYKYLSKNEFEFISNQKKQELLIRQEKEIQKEKDEKAEEKTRELKEHLAQRQNELEKRINEIKKREKKEEKKELYASRIDGILGLIKILFYPLIGSAIIWIPIKILMDLPDFLFFVIYFILFIVIKMKWEEGSF